MSYKIDLSGFEFIECESSDHGRGYTLYENVQDGSKHRIEVTLYGESRQLAVGFERKPSDFTPGTIIADPYSHEFYFRTVDGWRSEYGVWSAPEDLDNTEWYLVRENIKENE